MHRIRFRSIFVLIVGLWFTLMSKAGRGQQAGDPLAGHKWKHRIVLVWDFSLPASTVKRTLQAEAFREGIKDRQIVQYVLGRETGLGPEGALAVREREELESRHDLAADPAGWLLIGKDGTVKARGSGRPDWRFLFARIDQMPMRKREMRP